MTNDTDDGDPMSVTIRNGMAVTVGTSFGCGMVGIQKI